LYLIPQKIILMDKNVEYKLDEGLFISLADENVDKLKSDLVATLDAQEIDDHVDIMKSIDAYGFEKLRGELKSIHRRYYGVTRASDKDTTLKKILLSLVIISVILAALFFFQKTKTVPIDSTQLYAQYYEPYEYNSATRNAAPKSIFELGRLYQEKQYEEFINQYETYHKHRDDLMSDFILAIGISYTESGEPYKGIYQFDRIIDNQDFNYKNMALWYKALALLKADETLDCMKVLETLVSSQSDFQKPAKALLKDLKKLRKN